MKFHVIGDSNPCQCLPVAKARGTSAAFYSNGLSQDLMKPVNKMNCLRRSSLQECAPMQM